jgi:hypothetical protein
VVATLPLALAGCHRLHAKTEPVMPPLEVPAPPPRLIIAPLPATTTATATTEAAPADAAPAPPEVPAEVSAPRPSRAAAAPAARQEKAEPPPAPARPPAAAPASPTLQTTSGVGEARILATMGQASRDLDRINAAALNAEAKAQFDIARRFVQQANDALSAKNYVFAAQLADKAAALATLLLTQ